MGFLIHLRPESLDVLGVMYGSLCNEEAWVTLCQALCILYLKFDDGYRPWEAPLLAMVQGRKHMIV